jgi:hypothetical protein
MTAAPLEWHLSEAFDPGIAQFNLLASLDVASAVQRGRTTRGDLRAIRVEEGAYADVIGLSRVSLYAVSARFVAAARALTGVAFAPVELLAGPTGYFVLGVKATCGDVIYGQDQVVRQRGEQFVRLRGLVVDQPRPGSDFAMPANQTSILLTSRAAARLMSADLTNVNLRRMAEIEYDVPMDGLRSRDIRER